MDQVPTSSDAPIIADRPAIDDVALSLDIGVAATLVDRRPGQMLGFETPVMIAGRGRPVVSRTEDGSESVAAIIDVFERSTGGRILDSVVGGSPRAAVVVEVSDTGDERELAAQIVLRPFAADHAGRVASVEALREPALEARGGDVAEALVQALDQKAQAFAADRLVIIGDAAMWDTLVAQGFELRDSASVGRQMFNTNVINRAIELAELSADADADADADAGGGVDRVQLAHKLNEVVVDGLPKLAEPTDLAEPVIRVSADGEIEVSSDSLYSLTAVGNALINQVGLHGLRTFEVNVGEFTLLLGDSLFDEGVAGCREVGESAEGIETASEAVGILGELDAAVPVMVVDVATDTEVVAEPKQALPVHQRIRERDAQISETVGRLINDVRSGRWSERFDREDTPAEIETIAFFADLRHEFRAGETPVVGTLFAEGYVDESAPFSKLAPEVLDARTDTDWPVVETGIETPNFLVPLTGPFEEMVIHAPTAVELVASRAIEVPRAEDVQSDLARYARSLRDHRTSPVVSSVRKDLGKRGFNHDQAREWWLTPRVELGNEEAPICPAALVGTAREIELQALIGGSRNADVV